jgi:DNA-binding response OmpR family regulator
MWRISSAVRRALGTADALLEAGADAYLNKPIDFAALARVMNRVGGGRPGVRALAERGETAAAA